MPACKKCGKSFPNLMKIEDKVRNLCKRKYCLACSPFGQHNTRNLIKSSDAPDEKLCTGCNTTKPLNDFYKRKDGRNGFTTWCKKCTNQRSGAFDNKRGKKRKDTLLDEHNNRCAICGCRDIYALSFHHNAPDKKKHGLTSRILSGTSLSSCIEESKKCTLLCENCHEETHHPNLNIQDLLSHTSKPTPRTRGNTKERQHAKYVERKMAFIQQKGGECQTCGYSKNLSGLAFHHRDPSTKKFSLDARALGNRSLKSCKEELAKCDLLCCNCHMSHTPKSVMKTSSYSGLRGI